MNSETPETKSIAPAQIIADLAKNASGCEVLQIDTKGLSGGLPPKVPVLFDRRAGGNGAQTLADHIEGYRLAPERRKGTAQVETLQSFIDLTNRHKDEDSALFVRAAWPNPSLTAVIDYHKLDHTARWGSHCVKYTFPVTDEFTAWVNADGKGMKQAEFAAFIEEHAAELSSPEDGERSEFERLFHTKFATPSDMIALSRGLQVNVAAQVKNTVTLSSGEGEIVFVEEHKDSKGEKITVPGVFMVSVPAFLDGMSVRIPARLRYRARDGVIIWSYQLYRWRFWLRERVQRDHETAAKGTALPSYEGEPE